MRIDLHTHSSRSDGTDTPTELIQNAVRVGLDVVALTDHDATVGWDEAQAAADAAGIRLVKGIEISTTYQGRSVHLLGYDIDPDDPDLTAELQRVRDGRDQRLPRMLAKLGELGYPITEEDIAEQSGSAAASGRPHIADALIAKGYIKTRDEAFTGLLDSGGAAYVPRYSTPTAEAVRLVKAAGGIAVIAHPWAGRDEALSVEALTEFVEAGLDGIEVDHPDHDEADRAALREIAAELNMAVTGSSDYHGTGKSEAFALGVNTTDPEQFRLLFGE